MDVKEGSSNALSSKAQGLKTNTVASDTESNGAVISIYNKNPVSYRLAQDFNAIDLSSKTLIPIPPLTLSANDVVSNSPSSVQDSCVNFQLQLNTDEQGNQTSWNVTSLPKNDTVLSKEAGEYSNRKSYNETYCLKPGNYTFTIYDTGGNGLRPPFGNYTVDVAGKNVRQGGGNFGSFTNKQSTSFSVVGLTGPSISPTFSPFRISPYPASLSGMPSNGSSTPPSPGPLSCQFQLLINTDEQGNQTSWNVTSLPKNDTVLSKEAGEYSNRKSYNETYCLKPGNYTFTIYDTGGNGLRPPFGNYTVDVAGKNVRQGGGNFGSFTNKQSTSFSVVGLKGPRDSPTSQPTVRRAPSHKPSKTTSHSPTTQPTVLGAPSHKPSKIASHLPSISVQPSAQPSSRPSRVRTHSPSRSSRPSKAPTPTPSKPPTKKPTRHPTLHPSTFPSRFPSLSPTIHPTKSPSASPSFRPSISIAPSKSPSQIPSGKPSISPSRSPTIAPTPYSSYFETEVLIILLNVEGNMNASTTMVFRAVTQDFLQSNLPTDGEYTGYSCNITKLDVYAQTISLSAESNVFIESNNRSYSIGINNARFLVEDTQNLLVGLRIGGYVHPYNPSVEFMFPEYVLYGFEHNYRAYASSLSASGQDVFSQMKSSATASIFAGPAWALPTAILLAAAAVFFLASAFICCFFWKRNRRRQQKMEASRSNVEGIASLAVPEGEQPKPSVALFPSEVSDALALSEDDHGPAEKNRSSGYEPLPSTARKPRESNPFSESAIEQRPHGKNPFSDSFDTSEDEQQEEEAPLVQRLNFLETENRNEGIASASDDMDNDIESRSTSSSTQVENDDKHQLKAPVSRAEESDNECVVQSTQSRQRENESVSKSTSTVEDDKESTISKQQKDSSSSFSTSIDKEQEEGSTNTSLDEEGNMEKDFLVIDTKPLVSNTSLARRRLFKSRLARP